MILRNKRIHSVAERDNAVITEGREDAALCKGGILRGGGGSVLIAAYEVVVEKAAISIYCEETLHASQLYL